MINFDCILLCGGISKRFKENKILIDLLNRPLYSYSLNEILKTEGLSNLILVINEDDVEYFNNIVFPNNVYLTVGGEERYISVKNGLKLVKSDNLVIHDAARCLIKSKDILRLVNESYTNGLGTYYKKVTNTLRNVYGDTLNRDNIREIETPQFISKKYYELILNNDYLITDELSIIKDKPVYLECKHSNIKVTYPEDYKYVYNILNDNIYRIGHSYDVHKYKDGDSIILGGIKIPFNKSVLAHSDGDVYIHALAEAIYGALSDGDLGDHYPDSDIKYKECNSIIFLKEANELLKNKGYIIQNIDSLIYLESPKLKDYKKLMVENISKILDIPTYNISVKATTLEKLALTGTSDGLAVEVVVLIKKIN